MKCSCCISLRSACYFGASIHIFIGGIQFCLFLMKTGLFLVHNYSNRPVEPSLTLISFLILLVGAIYFPLGCVIFRGVEKDRGGLIRRGMWIFLLLKISEMAMKIYQEGLQFHPDKIIDWEMRLYQGIDVASASIYFLLLFFYSSKLMKTLRRNESDYFKSPSSDNTLTIRSNKLIGDDYS